MDGKLFLYNNATPPPISQVAATTFSFDLQRFAGVYDSSWNASSKLASGESIGSAEIAGYDSSVTSGNTHKIKVENAGVTKYFDYMQSAMNFVLGNALTKALHENNTEAVAQSIVTALNNYDSDGAVVTLLDDITDGYGFVIGRTKGMATVIADASTTLTGYSDYYRNAFYLPTNVKIDLNGKQYLVAHELNPSEVSNTATSKAIQISGNRKLAIENSNISIVGGTLGVAATTDTGLERYMRSYCNVTLSDVYLDGTGVNNQTQEADGALVLHTVGKLNIVGNTNIVTKGSNYYGVAGKFANNNADGYYMADSGIEINTNGKVGAVGYYEWGTTNYYDSSATNLTGSGLNIQKGEVDKLFISDAFVGKSAFNNITVGSSATINSITDKTADKLIYAGSSSTIQYSDDESNPKTGKVQLLGIEGWNKDPDTEDKFNYAAKASDYSAQNGKGKMLIGVTGAESTDDLAYSSADSIFAIPSAASGEWGWELSDADKTKYFLAKVDYNSDKDAVTISSATAASVAEGASPTISLSANTGGVLYSKVRTIDASTAGNVALAITGNSLNNTIYGNAGNDNISLNGGKNLFVFGGGEDVIKDYKIGNDTVGVANADFVPDGNSFERYDSGGLSGLKLTFGNGAVSVDGINVTSNQMPTHGVRVRNDATRKDYIFTNFSVADVTDDDANGITLGSAAGNSFVARNPFKVIDGTAASQAMSLTAYTGTNTNIIGGESATLIGSTGNDTLEGEQGNNYFVYTAGNDVISSYSLEGGDRVSLTPDNITGAKVSRDRLTFTVNKNTLTFNPVNDEVVGRVSLSTAGYLTKDGYVSADSNVNFKLFAGTKGKIDFKEDTIYSGGKITSIDAKDSKNSVTLTADSHINSVELAANKKKDLFEYDGGTVTISGYEAGKDRINIVNEAPIHAFAVDNGDVAISVTAGDTNVISLKGAATKEVLIHDADSKGNTYSKYIFQKTGVLYNKAKNPTEANLYSNAGNFTDAPSSIKKIFALGGVSGISIQSADNKATLDASEANSVSLVGGTKNNKFIGSNYADTFVYNGGKDVITNFQVGNVDALSIADTKKFSIGSAKITVSKKSLKFKFDSKNTLTLKSDSTVDSLSIGGQDYAFSKNAVSDGEGNVTLTSQFSGTYKIDKEDAGVIKSVDGSAVKKNLTFKGSDQAETLIGGQKKTTFKGGGAATGVDSLVGGAGKDIFFYAKGDKGESNIYNFGFGTGKDKLKIANGTIHTITSSGNNIRFVMTSGKKNDDAEIATFNVNTSNATGRIAIKANNTYYWFADEATANTTDGLSSNQLYTWDRKVTARDVAACDIIDLGYSTNLVKSKVAVKVATPTTNSSSSNN